MNKDGELELSRIKQIINICLLTANEPLSVEQIALAFDKQIEESLIEKIIFSLNNEYLEQGLELLRLSEGFRLRSQLEYQSYLDKVYQVKPPKYSRAVMETITIIAYRQPITRGEIESIRGVAVNSNAIQILFDREWIEVIGHKEVPGKPELLATTNKFLEDLGIASLQELPPLPKIELNELETQSMLIK
ncbi:MAG: SMC-Scp complex subunit ScpB [Neisseriaceae bacterium]